MPAAAKAFKRLKIPKNMIIKPTVLKKVPDQVFFKIAFELKLKSAKTGKVPKAKINIIKAPDKKLPVVKV